MASTKMFRSSIGGYNRDDVNSYIKETDSRHAEEIDALNAELENLSARLGEALSKIEILENDKSALSCEIDALRASEAEFDKKLEERDAKIAETRKEADFYRAESQAQINVISSIKAEKDALIAEIEVLKSTYEQKNENEHDSCESASANDEDRESDAYKLGMYNKISSQLGDIMINANRTAEEIVAKAKTEAENIKASSEAEISQKKTECDSDIAKIKSETEEEAAYIRKRLSSVCEELLSRASSELHSSIDSSVREINNYVTDIQYEIKALMTKLGSRSDEMYDRIGYYQSSVSESMDKRLAEMDKKYGITRFDTDMK